MKPRIEGVTGELDAFVHAGDEMAELKFSNNYWGTTNINEIDDKILDYNDDLSLSAVIKCEPFLTEPHPDTP